MLHTNLQLCLPLDPLFSLFPQVAINVDVSLITSSWLSGLVPAVDTRSLHEALLSLPANAGGLFLFVPRPSVLLCRSGLS